jgi:glycosyltransferase involved in cell wall biosynthesis
VYTACERLGWFGADPDQLRANAYGDQAENANDPTRTMLPKELRKLTNEYKFSIVVPAYETDVVFFGEMIESVCRQTYPNWQLVIADASKSDKLAEKMADYTDERICYIRLKENKGISENTNEALKHADGEYIGLLDHDDLLHPDALAEVASLIQSGGYEMVYTDEDKVNEDGSLHFEPNFKPDFNFDFLLSNNYICHFTVLSRSLMESLSFRPAFNGAQDYDLFLQAVYELESRRLDEIRFSEECNETEIPDSYIAYEGDYLKQKIGHVPKVLYHWRAHTASTADNPESKRYAYEAGKRALENFAAKNNWDVTVEHTKHLGFYRIMYKPDIFGVRADVTAVCGKKVRFGKVVAGPVVDGRELFAGMNAKYSGYMHKAVLSFEAEDADESCIRRRKDARRGGRMVYLPDFTVRK